MKKIIVTLIIVWISLPVFAQLKSGGGLLYGTEISQPGFYLKGIYSLSENIDGALGINIFFPNKEGEGGFESKISLWSLNFDAHYRAHQSGSITFYPLGGINITIYSFEIEVPNFFGGGTFLSSGSDTSVGLNLGGGLEYAINEKIQASSEIKYVLGQFDQLVISAGILFNIQLKSNK